MFPISGALFSGRGHRWYGISFINFLLQSYSPRIKINEHFITEFRECFYLFARNGQIRTLDELTIIMRSLGLSPTIAELNKYLKDKGTRGLNGLPMT